ncbi:MAG: nitric oxide reductase D protein, partial [Gemmobacter sp.]
AVLFRGLGGAASVELRAAADENSGHRLSFRRRLGAASERLPRASFDGEALRLPASLAVFPAREANAALYLWLAAAAAHAGGYRAEADPLRADLAALAAAQAMVARTLAEAPGLAGLCRDLSRAALALRPGHALPPVEAAVEALVRHLLGAPDPLPPAAGAMLAALEGDLSDFRAPRGYRPFRPVVVWPELRGLAFSAPGAVESRDTEGPPEEGEGVARRARRRQSDLAERRDSLILHKFEAILSWTEFLNLNRRVEDDDTDAAKKAAEDQDEIGLGQISKAPAARLKLHLDLAPEDVARERLSGEFTYPEWEARGGVWLPDHVRVLESRAPLADAPAPFHDDPAAQRRIRAVRRQFEALRPGRVSVPGQIDGEELDLDAALRAAADLRATGAGNDRVWRRHLPVARDLAVSILLDVSRSTESAVPGHGHGGRQVIDIEREALTALAWGLNACGDDFAINAFSSLKRDRVYLLNCKEFGEPMSSTVESRIMGLRPGFYTRLGAAIRHGSAGLAKQGRGRRLLLVITDGKPNDLDHYEGRHGIEDSAMAVREARRMGQAVFGITVDRDGKSWFPRIFGQGGYALIPHPDKLTAALPGIWRTLVGA